MTERFGRHFLTRHSRYAAGLFDFVGDSFVVGLIDHNRNRGMVLGGGADHRRTADVYVFNSLLPRAVIAGNSRSEGIKIDYQKIDGLDVMFGHLTIIGTSSPQQTAVDLRMQGLHSSIHHLGKACVI